MTIEFKEFCINIKSMFDVYNGKKGANTIMKLHKFENSVRIIFESVNSDQEKSVAYELNNEDVEMILNKMKELKKWR